jgi:predicted GIY-YIG superfamily endonuclease
MAKTSNYYVYVIQSSIEHTSIKTAKKLTPVTYVGCSTDVLRRIKQHNGELSGGARSTHGKGPWILRAVFGPYSGRGQAMKAEYALKHSKRSTARFHWTTDDSEWCHGFGINDPLVIAFSINNEALDSICEVLDKL